MPVSMGGVVPEEARRWRGAYEAGITSRCEPPCMGAGNQTLKLCRSSKLSLQVPGGVFFRPSVMI